MARPAVRATAPVFFLLVALGAGGCQSAPVGKTGSRHFQSRNEIVAAVDAMLRDKDWETLARYYDISGSSGSSLSAAQLTSGEYFYDSSPDAAPPGEEFRRYRHPFAPGARLDHEMDGDQKDVVVMVVVLELSRGERLVYRFRVKRHGWGWQLLPGG